GWIYGVIGKSNAAYASWLHDNGFADDKKRFKMFTFSKLYVSNHKVLTDRLCILSNTINLYLSFFPEKSTEEFIKGIFSDNEFTLGDTQSKVHFHVRNIEMLPPPVFHNFAFQAISPIVVSKKLENGGRKYLSPETENYGQLLFNNLKEKYKAFYGKPSDAADDFDFKLTSNSHAKLIKIKANTPQETNIRGFLFNFEMQTDEQLLNIMYEAGAGEKGSLGFGMVRNNCELLRN
ncbi:MAG: CRISPR-associated endoribonuclease Cas6, partial [Prevotellaceae bacterium]|nr:CRISPR-associated endoribonuclease Cas6 [Prevotellaceae bacterium]